MMTPLENEYFNWLCFIAIPDNRVRNNMINLLEYLYTVNFDYIMETDYNRWVDGNDLKYRFAYDRELSYDLVDDYLPRRCSMLALLVSLACRMEERYMAESDGTNKIPIWFSMMLDNLGIAAITNQNFDTDVIDGHLKRFMFRQYDNDGTGGLFRIIDCPVDMTKIDIWRQMSMFCSELLKNELKLL